MAIVSEVKVKGWMGGGGFHFLSILSKKKNSWVRFIMAIVDDIFPVATKMGLQGVWGLGFSF